MLWIYTLLISNIALLLTCVFYIHKVIFLQKQAKTSERKLKQLIHDIKSPLSAIKIINAKIEQDNGRPNNLISRSTKNIEDLLEDSIDQQLMLPQGVVDILYQIKFEAESLYPHLNVQITPHEATTNHKKIKAHRPKLKRILTNVVNNCIEANASAIKITLQQAKNLTITLQDNGIGMSQAVLEKVCNEGFSYGKNQPTATGPRGLGLFDARMTLKSWNGRLHIQSSHGQGAIVTIELA